MIKICVTLNEGQGLEWRSGSISLTRFAFSWIWSLSLHWFLTHGWWRTDKQTWTQTDRLLGLVYVNFFQVFIKFITLKATSLKKRVTMGEKERKKMDDGTVVTDLETGVSRVVLERLWKPSPRFSQCVTDGAVPESGGRIWRRPWSQTAYGSGGHRPRLGREDVTEKMVWRERVSSLRWMSSWSCARYVLSVTRSDHGCGPHRQCLVSVPSAVCM